MKKLRFWLALLIFSNSANAEFFSGELTGYIPYSEGHKEIIIFQIKDNPKGGCNVSARFAMDNTSPRYQATLTAIVAAYHSKTPIKVNYTSTCNSWRNSADAIYLCVGDLPC